MDQGNAALNDVLREMFETGDYPDLTISCDEASFDVHQNIVCSRSPVFAEYCAGGPGYFRTPGYHLSVPDEGDDQDVMELRLVWGRADSLACMLEFIYLDDYKVDDKDDNELCLHSDVYSLGERYKIPSLKKAALLKFHEGVRTNWSMALYFDVVEAVFPSTLDRHDDLQNMFAEMLHQRKEELAFDDHIQRCIREVDGLAFALWKRTVDTGPKPCPVCGSNCTLYGDVKPAKKRKRLAITQRETDE